MSAASVFGQTFWHGGVAGILGLPCSDPELGECLEALVDVELVQLQARSRLGNQKEYAFRHALVREAAYGLLASRDLIVGHRSAGEFLEGAGERDAVVIAEHFERSGDRQRAACFYLRAAEESMGRGNTIGALRQVDRGLGCSPQGELLGQLRSLPCVVAIYTNQYKHLRENCDFVMNSLQAGSAGWCRAVYGAIFAAMSSQDGARACELLLLLLDAEPATEAQGIYIEAIAVTGIPLSLTVPASLLRTMHRRLTEIVSRAEVTNPTIPRHLLMFYAVIGGFREPWPWSMITAAKQSKALNLQVGDSGIASILDVAGPVWGLVDLGDIEGAFQHLSALESEAFHGLDVQLSWWRVGMAWTLCQHTNEQAWNQAELLIAPLRIQTDGNILFPIAAQGISARVALLRGQLDSAEIQARAAMQMFSVMPVFVMIAAQVQLQALVGLGRAAEAVPIAEQVLATLAMLGGAGVHEVYVRLAISESFYAAGDVERAHTELRETLRQITIRLGDISDPAWKNSYLTRNKYCVRAQALAKEWGVHQCGVAGGILSP